MSYFRINKSYIYKGYLVKVVHINVHSDISTINIYTTKIKILQIYYNMKFACTSSSYAKTL